MQWIVIKTFSFPYEAQIAKLKRGWGVFLYGKAINKELFKYRITNHFWMLTWFY